MVLAGAEAGEVVAGVVGVAVSGGEGEKGVVLVMVVVVVVVRRVIQGN